MNTLKLKIGIAAIAVAIGTAFVTRASEAPKVSMDDESFVQLGYYKVPTNPDECESFMNVPCSPVETEDICEFTVPVHGLQQIYDEGCTVELWRED